MLFRQASLAHAVKIGSTPLKQLENIKYVKKKDFFTFDEGLQS